MPVAGMNVECPAYGPGRELRTRYVMMLGHSIRLPKSLAVLYDPAVKPSHTALIFDS